jgi:SAM-dependent methyltransferase
VENSTKVRLKSLLKRFLRRPADALLASSSKLPNMITRTVGQDFSISSRYAPYLPEQDSFAILQNKDQTCGFDENNLPIPPQELWLNYGQTAEEYLDMGKRHISKMQAIVGDAGHSLAGSDRILDFGCAGGRMIRQLYHLTDTCEIWGCDISATHVLWCQRYLSPPFQFVTNTTQPHLPFEDHYFGFIYAGSVFTNLAELADTWLLELRRVLRPGGLLYATIHDEHTRQIYAEQKKDTTLGQMLLDSFQPHHLSPTDMGMFAIFRTPGMTQVFYDISYIRRHWSRYFEILSVTEEAYGPQTAILMQRRQPTVNNSPF